MRVVRPVVSVGFWCWRFAGVLLEPVGVKAKVSESNRTRVGTKNRETGNMSVCGQTNMCSMFKVFKALTKGVLKMKVGASEGVAVGRCGGRGGGAAVVGES